jgi:hypothetical protein
MSAETELRHHLAVLGLPEHAPFSEIRLAYRDLVKVWHPDRFSPDEERLRKTAERKLKELNASFDWLERYFLDRDDHSSVPPSPPPSIPQSQAPEDGSDRPAQGLDRSVFIALGVVAAILVVVVIAALSPSATERPNIASAPRTSPSEMTLIVAGDFTMRFGEHADRGKPSRRVYLDAYYIDTDARTTAEFDRFVNETGYETTAERVGWSHVSQGETLQKMKGATWRTPSGPGSSAAPSHPVVHVSWHDADSYCRWAGKRLPSEAELEKAWPDPLDPMKGFFDSNAFNGLGRSSVRAGDYWHWTADWYGAPIYVAERNPAGPISGSTRVRRSGWLGLNGWPPPRRHSAPDSPDSVTGFRCARGCPGSC